MQNEYEKIPKRVYEDPHEQIKFLREVFDKKGYIRVRIRKRGKKKSKIRNLRLVDKNIKFIRNVQYFLKKQGIKSVVYRIGNHFCLDIEGKGRLEMFLKIIGFSNEKKLKEMQEALKPLSLSRNEQTV